MGSYDPGEKLEVVSIGKDEPRARADLSLSGGNLALSVFLGVVPLLGVLLAGLLFFERRGAT